MFFPSCVNSPRYDRHCAPCLSHMLQISSNSIFEWGRRRRLACSRWVGRRRRGGRWKRRPNRSIFGSHISVSGWISGVWSGDREGETRLICSYPGLDICAASECDYVKHYWETWNLIISQRLAPHSLCLFTYQWYHPLSNRSRTSSFRQTDIRVREKNRLSVARSYRSDSVGQHIYLTTRRVDKTSYQVLSFNTTHI